MPSISNLPNLSAGTKLAVTISIGVFVGLIVAVLIVFGTMSACAAYEERKKAKERNQKMICDAEAWISLQACI